MIPPTPGPDPASRLFGYATPPDGAGPIGPEQYWPVAVTPPREEVMRGLNPLHYVPGLGMMFHLSGQTIPTTMRVLGAGLVGGPMGILTSGLMGIAEAILTLPPDMTRPAAPAGMSATGSEAGVQPTSPGTLSGGAYTTLATTRPEWMGSEGGTALAGDAPVQRAAAEYRRAMALEKGLA